MLTSLPRGFSLVSLRRFVVCRFRCDDGVKDKYQHIASEIEVDLYATSRDSVFYNPCMVVNRDMSVGMVRVFHKLLSQLTHDRNRVQRSIHDM